MLGNTEPSAPTQLRNLIASIATIAVCDIAFGLTFPLLAILLEQRSVPAWIIGLNAAMGPLGIIVAGPLIAGAVKRFGARRLAHATIIGIAALLIAFKIFPSLIAWFVLRFAFGVIAGTLYTLSEAWIVHFSAGPRRGRIIGIYTSVASITFSAGPLIIPYVDVDGWVPWIIGAAMILVAGIPLFFLEVEDEFGSGESEGGFVRFIGRAPLLLFAVCTLTMFDAIMLSFFIIYGLRNGLDVKSASWALGMLIAGNAVLQYPIGILSDRWSRTAIMWLAGGICVAMAALLPLTVAGPFLWPVAFVMGTAAYAIYTASLAVLGDQFKGAELLSGSAAFAAMWGVGGIIGPPLAGAALDAFGVNALPACIVAIYGSLLALLGASGGRLVRAGA